jgi:hypothetical protein
VTVSVADIDRWDAGDVREVFHAGSSPILLSSQDRGGDAVYGGWRRWSSICSRSGDLAIVDVVTTAILDATELSSDFLCRGLKYQLLANANFHWLSVVVPQSVLEEVIANHQRQVCASERELRKVNRERKRLGVPLPEIPSESFDYRAYLMERFDTQLGIELLPWPTVDHADLVRRAISRTPPFNENGGGYRDSLVWASVLELARKGHDVALVSADRSFAGTDGKLSPALAAEAELLPGTVELVRHFGPWLLERVPWQVESLKSAVAASMSERFFEYFLQSDLQEDLRPDSEDLGFHWAPYTCEIIESEWGGFFSTVETRVGPDGLAVVEFDIDQLVRFEALFDQGMSTEANWHVDEPDILGRVRVEGEVDLIVRIAVVFGDEFGVSIDELTWRRADGTRPGRPSLIRPSEHQLPLLDVEEC